MKKIRHTGIVVSNLKKGLYFYRNLLGLKVDKRKIEPASYINRVCRIKKGRVTTVKLTAEDGGRIELLYFYSYPKTIKKNKIYEVGFSHLAFTVKDIDTEYRRLLKAGVKFYSPPQFSRDGYAKLAFCEDFDQNPIELVQAL